MFTKKSFPEACKLAFSNNFLSSLLSHRYKNYTFLYTKCLPKNRDTNFKLPQMLYLLFSPLILLIRFS